MKKETGVLYLLLFNEGASRIARILTYIQYVSYESVDGVILIPVFLDIDDGTGGAWASI